MPSSSSSNSRLRSGPRPQFGPESSSSHSESASGSSSESGSGSSSGSGSRSVSKSSHGSYSTFPKRKKKFSVTKLNDEQTGPSVLAKFQDRLAKNLWEAVVSKVRVPAHKIRKKYHIPSDFDVVTPATFDRMHRPPEGFSAFSIKHLDAGLRFPLAPPVAAILNKLGLCPMQISPNSITHIVLFVVIMQFVGLDPSFDNFWSLYSFTTSKRSGSRGFFYLSAKPECRYLSALKSNVGVWLDRYIFIRSPSGVWPIKNEWTKYKPIPKISGGGLEGDQIRSLTSYKYDPKKLLTEKILQLSGLSPASLHIEESLGNFLLLVSLAFIAVVLAYANSSLLADSIIMSTRTAMRRIASQNKTKKGGEIRRGRARRLLVLQIYLRTYLPRFPQRRSRSQLPTDVSPLQLIVRIRLPPLVVILATTLRS
ncbi:uncharacterized protein LOC110012108 isoform X1 [Sesamum indicum]|uniref:Uncharacterized protein LOC110012108 isoform X1 n=1 Tax=Sesamum indicum TaxID=4182 RepID=A0A8M8V0U5_SESIN|nr:uncharacterized protein LOC110012108 isoform X1 [Sesamum indicum]